jgi:hypothetical protein
MGKRDKAKLKSVTVRLPFGIGEIEWEADPAERRAAWALYVELVTRVAVQPMAGGEGLVSEALSSLQQVFPATREILRDAGPEVGAARDSIGGIAIAVLNRGLRPFLAKWHPLVQAWEAERPAGLSPAEHEQRWPPELRAELAGLRADLAQYADALATLAGVAT